MAVRKIRGARVSRIMGGVQRRITFKVGSLLLGG